MRSYVKPHATKQKVAMPRQIAQATAAIVLILVKCCTISDRIDVIYNRRKNMSVILLESAGSRSVYGSLRFVDDQNLMFFFTHDSPVLFH